MSLNIISHFKFNFQHNWEGLQECLRRKRIFTLASFDFCISTLTVKLGIRIFEICNYYSDEVFIGFIQSPWFSCEVGWHILFAP